MFECEWKLVETCSWNLDSGNDLCCVMEFTWMIIAQSYTTTKNRPHSINDNVSNGTKKSDSPNKIALLVLLLLLCNQCFGGPLQCSNRGKNSFSLHIIRITVPPNSTKKICNVHLCWIFPCLSSTLLLGLESNFFCWYYFFFFSCCFFTLSTLI